MNKELLHDELFNAFQYILNNYSDILLDGTNSNNRLVSNLIGDLIVHSVKDRNIAMVAASSGVLSELLQIVEKDIYYQNITYSKLHKKLVDNYGIDSQACEAVLAVFTHSIGMKGIKPISGIDQYLEILKNLPEIERLCVTCKNSNIPGVSMMGKGDDILDQCIEATKNHNLKWNEPLKKLLSAEELELDLYNRINGRGIIIKIVVRHLGAGRGKLLVTVYKEKETDIAFIDAGYAKNVKLLMEEISNNQDELDIKRIYSSFLRKCKTDEIRRNEIEIEQLQKDIAEKNQKYLLQQWKMKYPQDALFPVVVDKSLPSISEIYNIALSEDRGWYLIEINNPIGAYKESTKLYETLINGIFVRIKTIECDDKYGGKKTRYNVSFNPMYGFRTEYKALFGECPKLALLLQKIAIDICTNNKSTKIDVKKKEKIHFSLEDVFNQEKTKDYPVINLFDAFWNNKNCYEKICRNNIVDQDVNDLFCDIAKEEEDYLLAKIKLAAKTNQQCDEYDLRSAVAKKMVGFSEREIHDNFWWEKKFQVNVTYDDVNIGTYVRKDR